MKELRAKIRADLLKEIVSIANTLSDEAKITVNSGLSYKIVDPSDVSMLDGNFPKEIFEEFHNGEEFEFGLDIDKVVDFLKNAKKGDIVSIEYVTSEDKEDRIRFSVRNVTNTYNVLIIDGMSDPKVPTINLPNHVTLDTKEVFEYLKNNKKLSDYFKISWEDDSFKMSIDGDSDKSQLKISELFIEHMKLEDKTANTLFSYDYFSDMIKQIKHKNVKIRWGTDYPTIIEWGVGSHGTVRNLLAPRIED